MRLRTAATRLPLALAEPSKAGGGTVAADVVAGTAGTQSLPVGGSTFAVADHQAARQTERARLAAPGGAREQPLPAAASSSTQEA